MKTLLLSLLAAVPLAAADVKPDAKPDTKPEPRAEAKALPFLGVSLDEVDDALAYHLELKNDLGVLVAGLQPGSPAETMGLKAYDVIVGADGQPVYTPRAFTVLVRGKAVGDRILLQVRRGARTEEVSGTVGARPADLGDGHQGPSWPRRLGPPLMGPNGNRRGTMVQPDGSTMEWSIEDSPNAPSLGAP